MSEIVLPTPEPVEPAALPTPEPVAEPDAVVLAPEPAAEPIAEPAPEPSKGSMLAELISERRSRKDYERQVKDYQQAVMEGRLVPKPVAPDQTPDERERISLTKTAERLKLFTVNDRGEKVYDWDTARAFQQEVREATREQVAPLQQMTMQEQANKVMADIWARAQAEGVPKEALDVAADEFRAVMRMPNAAQTIAQREIAETIYERALGKAYRGGKLTGAPAKPKAQTPAAIITEPSGRRGPAGAALQINPALEQVYRANGLDPTKTPGGGGAPKVDARGHMELQ